MYSSSLGYLPSKKQSNLSGSVPNNLSLLHNYSKSTFPQSSFTKLVNSTEMRSSFDVKHRSNQFTSRTQSIMSFVYTLGGSSRLNQSTDICPNLTRPSAKSGHNFKELVVHYNNVGLPSIPLASSHLVGGFVGSKSQLGRTQGFEVKMWDIIRDLLNLVGSSTSTTKISQKSTSMEKKYCGNSSEELGSQMNVVKSSEVETATRRKQTYADVTKSKLPVSKVGFIVEPSQNSIDRGINKMKGSENKYTPSCKALAVIETVSKCSKQNLPLNRDRITSECSADSEDSFIVFENCEEDIHIPDDISNSSDDENDCHINGELSSEDRSRKSTTSSCGKSNKKVRFAEGKELTKVHPMITWDYAYRMARPGPWEMLARDSVRFRCRIANTEAVLKPVLEPRHREAVYQSRFAS